MYEDEGCRHWFEQYPTTVEAGNPTEVAGYRIAGFYSHIKKDFKNNKCQQFSLTGNFIVFRNKKNNSITTDPVPEGWGKNADPLFVYHLWICI